MAGSSAERSCSTCFAGMPTFSKWLTNRFQTVFSLLPFAQIQFCDRLLGFLQPNGITIFIIIFDDLFLMARSTSRHGKLGGFSEIGETNTNQRHFLKWPC